MGKIERICHLCGSRFKVYESPSRIGRGKFCSAACQRKGRERSPFSSGPNWQGGRITRPDGRIDIWIGQEGIPLAPTTRNGYVLEHRLVMAAHLNRPLTKDETVHHINGDTRDNRLANLQLRLRHGQGQVYVCGECGSHNIRPKELA